MSFARGLLAGTQAAQNVMDSYKSARDARIEREYAQGLEQLDKQQQLAQQGYEGYLRGDGTERFQQVPTEAPKQFDQGLMPEPVPRAPMTQEQLVQQQLALANRLGLRQEAGNFTNQLNAIEQRRLEEQRYTQQGLFAEQKFEADENFRRDDLAIRERDSEGNANLRTQQIAGLKAQEQRAQREQDSRDAANFGKTASYSLLNTGEVDFARLGELGPEAVNAFYDNLVEQGINLNDMGQLSQSFTGQLDNLYSTNYEGNEDTQLQAVTALAQKLDPDASNNVPVSFVRQEDGSYIVEENGVPLAQGTLDDIVTQFKKEISDNPMGYGVKLYSINRKQLDANTKQIEAALKAAELSADKNKLVMDGLKAIMGRTMPPQVGSPEYNQEVYGLFEVAGVPLQQVPKQFWPENAEQIIAAQGGADEKTPPTPPPTPQTADERVAAALESQKTKLGGLDPRSGTPEQRLAALKEIEAARELEKTLPVQERKASVARYTAGLDSGELTIEDLLLLKSDGELGKLERDAIDMAVYNYRMKEAARTRDSSNRTGLGNNPRRQ